jgi:ATP-binding protein involved in chromosome partitioning
VNKPLTKLEEAVAAALDGVKDPIRRQGLVACGRVQGLSVSPEGRVRCVIEAPPEAAERYADVRDAAERAVRKVRGVTGVTVALTAHAEVTSRPAAPPAQPKARSAEGIAGVGAVIAVASGKGGVGKSTVAVNLACALAAQGARVGLLDIDVFGPSVPTLTGTAGVKPTVGSDKKLIPLQAFGLKVLSIGHLVNADQAMIWRGPMVTSAIRQMLDEVAWAPLDILVLDMPPGTGDAQLTIAQRTPLDGAVIVSTPQELALADVRRGVAMFDKTHAPILGVIENMAWLEQPGGGRLHLFGEGGARRTAEALGAPFLGELPIDVALRESADAGHPLVATQPDHPMAARFAEMATAVRANMAAAAKPQPVIRIV